MPEELSEAARRFLLAIAESEDAVEAPDSSTLTEYALGLLDEDEEARVLRWAVLDSDHRETLIEVTRSVEQGIANKAVAKSIVGRYLSRLAQGALSPSVLKVTMTGLAQAWAAAGPRFEFGFARGTQPGDVMVERTEDGLKIDVREDAGSTLLLVDPVGGHLMISDLEFSEGFAEVTLPDPGLTLDIVARMVDADHLAQADEVWLPIEGSNAKASVRQLRLVDGIVSATIRTEGAFESPIIVSIRLGDVIAEIGSLEAGELGPTPRKVSWPLNVITGEGDIPLPGLLVMQVAE